MSKKKLATSTAIISSGIMTSRILGLIRDIFIANFFGGGIAAEAFFIAFTIPNALRQLVAEGAVNTVLVPVFTKYSIKESKAEFWRLASILFNVFAILLVVIVIAGILIAPILAKIIAPGFVNDAERMSLTVRLIRMLFPYILLIGLTAYFAGILNTFKHFTAPAFASTVLNATMISSMLLFYPGVTIGQLAAAVLVGGVLQLSIQIPPFARQKPLFNLRLGFVHREIKHIGKLLLPRMVGAGIYQINIIVDRMLASLHLIVGSGAIAALYYGNRLFQLPLALFGIAVATAALPTMSSFAEKKDIEELKGTIAFSLKNMLFFSMPASVGLMVLSRPIITVLFERGDFTPYVTAITSSALFFYAIGLIAYGSVKVLVAAFHSMQDTATPVKVACVALVSNIVLNLLLMVPLKAGGLALATSLSGFINAGALYFALRSRIGRLGAAGIPLFLIKLLVASAVMGAATYGMQEWLAWGSLARNICNLTFIILTGIGVYIIMALILRIRNIKPVMLWRRKN